MGSCVCWCATWGERSFADYSYWTSLLTLCSFLFRAPPERSVEPLQDSTGAIVTSIIILLLKALSWHEARHSTRKGRRRRKVPTFSLVAAAAAAAAALTLFSLLSPFDSCCSIGVVLVWCVFGVCCGLGLMCPPIV